MLLKGIKHVSTARESAVKSRGFLFKALFFMERLNDAKIVDVID